MKDLIEKHLTTSRKKKVNLAEFFNITRAGLDYKIKHDSWDIDELKKLAAFFETSEDEFLPKPASKSEPTMWELLTVQLEKRVEELQASLNDARYTIQLQRKMLEQNPFKVVSKIPPVKGANLNGMYIPQKSLMRA